VDVRDKRGMTRRNWQRENIAFKLKNGTMRRYLLRPVSNSLSWQNTEFGLRLLIVPSCRDRARDGVWSEQVSPSCNALNVFITLALSWLFAAGAVLDWTTDAFLKILLRVYIVQRSRR
jgi:hypothetical protein